MANEEVLKAIRERDDARTKLVLHAYDDVMNKADGTAEAAIAAALDALAVDWRAEADQWMESATKTKLRTATELRQVAARVAGVAVKLRELTPEPAPERDGHQIKLDSNASLISAAQTGQLLIGPYLTVTDAGLLVDDGYAMWLYEEGADVSDESTLPIGIKVTEAGRKQARELTAQPEPAHVVPENDDVSAYLRGDIDVIPSTPPRGTSSSTWRDEATGDTVIIGGDTPATSELNREARAMTQTFPISSAPNDDPFSDPGPPRFMKAASGKRYSFAELLTPPPASSLPGHWSYSQLETSEDCGLKYRAQRIDRIPQVPQWALIGGDAFHACAAEIERAGGIDRDPRGMWDETFHKLIAETAASTHLPVTDWRASNGGKEGYDWWRVEGSQMLNLYAEHRTQELERPQGRLLHIKGFDSQPVIEHEFNINVRGPLGDVPFKSIVDQAWLTSPTSINIVDLKTSRTVTTDTFQLGSQAWALFLGMFDKWEGQITGQYYDARKGVYTPPVDLLDKHPWDELVYRVHSAEAKCRAGIYTPRPSSFCGGCSVRYACPVGGR